MFGVAVGGTNARLTVDEAIKTAVLAEGEDRPRGVKVTADAAAEKLLAAAVLPFGKTLAEDFKGLADILEDGVPCLVLLRLNDDGTAVPSGGDEAAKWAMVAWTPSDSPVKQRMLCASSRRTLRLKFSELSFKEYPVTERSEVTLEQFLESTRETTEADRKAAMTQGELDAEEVRRLVDGERKVAPKKLAGLVALQVNVQPSFESGLARLLEGGGGLALLAHLRGTTGEELHGELLEDVAGPTQLRGKLPSTEPCYAILPLHGGPGMLLISWLPEAAEVKRKMKCSTFKASVLEQVRERLSGAPVARSEISSEEDLDDSTADAAAAAAAAEQAEASAAADALPAAPKRPVGGVALPGMGGKPVGGVALPGMGGLGRPR